MEVLILAAGRGERMRPLTDRTPKPLLKVADRRLIEHHIENLVRAGHRQLVVNLAHLGTMIEDVLGDGTRFGARIAYSREPDDALETGGGIVQALRYIEGDCFAVVNGDVWTDFPYTDLKAQPRHSAWLVLADNPRHHPDGDFVLDGDTVREKGSAADGESLTFAGIAVYRRRLFEGLTPGRYPLLPILIDAIRRGEVEAAHYRGTWMDIGTPQRLKEVRSLVEGR